MVEVISSNIDDEVIVFVLEKAYMHEESSVVGASSSINTVHRLAQDLFKESSKRSIDWLYLSVYKEGKLLTKHELDLCENPYTEENMSKFIFSSVSESGEVHLTEREENFQKAKRIVDTFFETHNLQKEFYQLYDLAVGVRVLLAPHLHATGHWQLLHNQLLYENVNFRIQSQ